MDSSIARWIASGALAGALATSGAAAQSSPAGGANQGKDKTQVLVATPNHTQAMQGLLDTAQKLRESIQALAQEPPGPKRQAALEAARDALILTQRAMLDLPAQMRTDGRDVREATDWPKAMARLQEAALRLSDSIAAMSKQSAGQGTSDALKTASRALDETEQAMLALPDMAEPK